MVIGAETSTRAGRYISQATGYRAFIPARLPPEPALEFTGELPSLLSAADRALGRLDGSVLTLPNPDLFVFMYVRKAVSYTHLTDALKLHFNQQLDKLAAAGFIEFKPEQGAAAAPAGDNYQATLTGSGAIAQGRGAQAVGAGGVLVGGNNSSNINTCLLYTSRCV